MKPIKEEDTYNDIENDWKDTNKGMARLHNRPTFLVRLILMLPSFT